MTVPEVLSIDAAPPPVTARRPGPDVSRVRECILALSACGLRPGVRHGPAGYCSDSGISIRVPVRLVLESGRAMQQLIHRLRRNQQNGTPVALCFTDLETGDAAGRSLETVCRHVRRATTESGCRDLPITTGVLSHQLPLQAYLLICNAELGAGPRYLLLDSLQLQHHACEQVQHESERNWLVLWNARHSRDRLIPAYANAVRTPCPLLSDEVATGILAGPGIQVPDGSAWLPISLPLTHFADSAGHVSWKALGKALATCIDTGEQLLDALRWGDAVQRHDVRQNRRLAVCLEGIGDLVLRKRANPANLDCLQWLDETIGQIHAELWAQSRRMAGNAELLPSLAQSDPSTRWHDTKHREDWHSRWQRALANSAVRHRNLLVMSPYSLLPSGGCGTAAFTDLTPVLQHADAFRFADPPAFRGWNIKEFKHFHKRSWAIIQHQNSASFIAAGA